MVGENGTVPFDAVKGLLTQKSKQARFSQIGRRSASSAVRRSNHQDGGML